MKTRVHILCEVISSSEGVSTILDERLRGLSDLRQLDVLTDILTGISEVDERSAELVYAAWTKLYEGSLWAFKYESLDQYRQLISYRDTVRPILRRFKKSDRSKASSMQTIERSWKQPVAQVIPHRIRPSAWSKHLLFTLATLSRIKPRQEAVMLLEASVNNRPPRSRQTSNLMASDVNRVLEQVSTHEHKVPNNSSPRSSRLSEKSSSKDFISPSSSPVASISGFNYTASDANLSNLSSSSDGETTLCSPSSMGCECSPICLPLMILLSSNPPDIREELVLGLFRWAQSVSWSSLCLWHMQCLAAFKFGDQAFFWAQSEIIHHLEQVLLEHIITEEDLTSNLLCM
ncbi:hypothetical protein FE257_012186 [Aspergillus nanangensis]|uniref:Uncharacterized protein n=1 Tax=Aspergillus nanangensis TaxID=2582783 RepID=A0AAD4CGF8_ASPNN|nr:hypothetical protein FE257_012186 [Aspergillus nanangensis]